jgi:hypothetical protein
MISFEDGSILVHAKEPYDPRKAHEYYLRTRKLHPRQHGAATYTVTRADGKTVKLTAKQLHDQKEYAAKRVAHIKKNLADLTVLLHDKLKKAKESAAKAAKPPTLAEKAKAARDAEKYRKAHKQSIANKAKQAASKVSSSGSKSKAAKVDTVDSLKADIKKTRANLKAAVANQRSLATAKKNG